MLAELEVRVHEVEGRVDEVGTTLTKEVLALRKRCDGNRDAGKDFEQRLRDLEGTTRERDEDRRKEAFDAIARAVYDGGEGASGTKLLMSGAGAPSMLSRMIREAADLARFLETGETPRGAT